MHESMAVVKGALGGHEAKKEAPKSKKEVKEVRIRKAKNHGHIIEHHHTNPVDHPMEEHTTGNDDELASHVLTHMGTPNPGEGQDENAAPTMAAAQTAAPAGGAPTPGMGA